MVGNTLKDMQGWVKETWKKAPKQVNEKDELLFLRDPGQQRFLNLY